MVNFRLADELGRYTSESLAAVTVWPCFVELVFLGDGREQVPTSRLAMVHDPDHRVCQFLNSVAMAGYFLAVRISVSHRLQGFGKLGVLHGNQL